MSGYVSVDKRTVSGYPDYVVINQDVSCHVETVVLLSKGEINSKKMHVGFSLEEMDICGF